LALIVNKTHNTGVDIELIRDKVKQVKHKFLNAAEALAAGESIEHLVRFWAAKETLYKIYGLKELDFIENLAVEDFEDNKIIGKITKHHFHQKQLLHWEKLGQYILVYSVHEI
jgi:phosphopantetheinyl transferase